MATDKIPFSLRLPQEVLDDLRVIANKEKRSVNNLIEYFIEQGVNKYKIEKEY
jgi:hypothetical protein